MKLINHKTRRGLTARAAAAPRRRANHNLHPAPDDPVQRSSNAIAPGVPAEGDGACPRFVEWFRNAVPGARPPGIDAP